MPSTEELIKEAEKGRYDPESTFYTGQQDPNQQSSYRTARDIAS